MEKQKKQNKRPGKGRLKNIQSQLQRQEDAVLKRDLTPKMKALFSHPSPSPVKAALNHVGIEVGGCRLPILALDDAQESVLFNQLGI